jgi:hypothetical protein
VISIIAASSSSSNGSSNFNIFTTQAMQNSELTRILGYDHLHTNHLIHELNLILILNFKFTLSEYSIITTSFVGLEVSTVGKRNL